MRKNILWNTYLDLGRLEGGDAADEGGSEEGRHFDCVVCLNDERARARGGLDVLPRNFRLSDRQRHFFNHFRPVDGS